MSSLTAERAQVQMNFIVHRIRFDSLSLQKDSSI